MTEEEPVAPEEDPATNAAPPENALQTILDDRLAELQAWAATLPPLPEGLTYRFDVQQLAAESFALDDDVRLVFRAIPQFVPGLLEGE